MVFEQEVKEIAYKLDPECWLSYSGKPRLFKSYMDDRRSSSLKRAQKVYDEARKELEIEVCPCCGRPIA